MKDISEKKYKDFTYIAKNIKINKFISNKELENKIDKDELVQKWFKFKK